MLELQKDIPDFVIFYDGVNDVYSAYQNKIAGVPQHGATPAYNIKYISYFVNLYTTHSYFWSCFTYFKNKLLGTRDKSVYATDTAIENEEKLAEDVIDTYSHNMKIIDWCHLGENGNEIVANKIGKTIQEDLRERE